MRGVLDWIGDWRLHLQSRNTLRRNRLPPNVWLCSAYRSNDVELDHGQTRPDLPIRRGLRAGYASDLWTGRSGFGRAERFFPVECGVQLEKTAHWLFER